MFERLLITGGCGFIGSNFIRYLLEQFAHVSVVNLDQLTYAGNLQNLADIEDDPRYTFSHGDITDVEHVAAIIKQQRPQAVVNFAAESHVDRSILDSTPFVRTNVMGTQVLLDACRACSIERFVQISTDEVYGSLGADGRFQENTPLAPNSPYSASKAGGDFLARAAFHTFGLPVIVTRCSNNYGPYQFPEKLIPLFIANASKNEPVPVYGDGGNVRDWIHVSDHCRGIAAALEYGRSGEIYNFGGEHELNNLELTRQLLAQLGKPESLIRFVTDRPGHDLRYAIDCSKAKQELGWQPEIPFAEGLRQTIDWYSQNQDWVQTIQSGAYRDYYREQYGKRLNSDG